MNFQESNELLSEQYKSATTMDLKIFNEYIERRHLQYKLDEIIREIIKNDNREKYRNNFPNSTLYEEIIERYIYKSNNQFDYAGGNIIDKLRDKTPTYIIGKVHEVNQKWFAKKELTNLEIDCLHEWSILVSEKEHAEESGMDAVQVATYLEYVKQCVIKGIKPDRPYVNENKFMEFKHSNKMQKFSDIKGTF